MLVCHLRGYPAAIHATMGRNSRAKRTEVAAGPKIGTGQGEPRGQADAETDGKFGSDRLSAAE